MLKEQIKLKRKSIGISQYELAEKIGVRQQWIAQIEQGIRTPSLKTIIEMAKVFNCSLDELVGMDKIRDDFWNEQLRKEV